MGSKDLESFKYPVVINGVTHTPLFSVIKNCVKITRVYKGEKTYNFTYAQAKAYNKIIKGEIYFCGMFSI